MTFTAFHCLCLVALAHLLDRAEWADATSQGPSFEGPWRTAFFAMVLAAWNILSSKIRLGIHHVLAMSSGQVTLLRGHFYPPSPMVCIFAFVIFIQKVFTLFLPTDVTDSCSPPRVVSGDYINLTGKKKSSCQPLFSNHTYCPQKQKWRPDVMGRGAQE